MYRMNEAQLLKALADERSIGIFQAVRRGEKGEKIKQRMSRKEFYVRMHRLKALDLVKMKQGYHLTTFGKLTACELLDTATSLCKNYWGIKAIDTLEDMTVEDMKRAVSSLIKDKDLRKVLQ
jgi:predicted transcriptional regulator